MIYIKHMKKISFLILVIVFIFQLSCITDNKYKDTDIFNEFETEQGFGVFHIPPILFKIVFSFSDDEKDINSKDLLDKIDVIKVMFYEEKENSIGIDSLKKTMNAKINEFNYNLLTRIAQKDSDISIFIIDDNNETIREVLVTIVSKDGYVGLNIVGELTKEEVMQVYKSVNMQEILKYNN